MILSGQRVGRCLVVAMALTMLGADWPQLLGPSRNGVSSEKELVGSWPKAGPTEVWRHTVGQGYASPVIADGKLVIFHRVGAADLVECLEAATGKRVWKFEYETDYRDPLGKGDGPRATPVLADGKVYTMGAQGMLHCLTLKDGKKVWDKDLTAEYKARKGYFGLGSSPIVEGDLLVLNIGGEDAGIVALNKETGKLVWKATEDEASYSSPITADVEGERRLVFFTREGLEVLVPKSGKRVGTRRFRARIDASVNAAMPVLLEGNQVFLTSSYDTGALLVKLKKDGFEEVYKSNKLLSAHFSTPVAVGKYLFGFEGRQEAGAELRCIDWKAKKVQWTKEGFGCGSLILADEKLFILSEEGELVIAAPNGEKYEEKARASALTGPVRAHLALADGVLFGRDKTKLVAWKVRAK